MLYKGSEVPHLDGQIIMSQGNPVSSYKHSWLCDSHLSAVQKSEYK